MIDLAPDIVALLLLAAFAAGFVDAIAGGGGLITVPVLMLSGLPPVTALATNKVQGVFGAATAALAYARAGQVDLRAQAPVALLAGAAGVAGTFCVALLPVGLIRAGLPVVLIAIAIFFAVKPGLTDADRAQRLPPVLFALLVVPPIAFYDGLIGPGTGTFFMIGFVLLAGFGVLKATAHTKLLNFASNLGSLLAFAVVTQPVWALGLMMGAAQVGGAALGARLAVRVGARLIRPLLTITASLLALRLLLSN